MNTEQNPWKLYISISNSCIPQLLSEFCNCPVSQSVSLTDLLSDWLTVSVTVSQSPSVTDWLIDWLWLWLTDWLRLTVSQSFGSPLGVAKMKVVITISLYKLQRKQILITRVSYVFKLKMPQYCCVPGCTNKKGGHLLPKEQKIRLNYKHAIMSIYNFYKAEPDCLIRSMIFRSFVEALHKHVERSFRPVSQAAR